MSDRIKAAVEYSRRGWFPTPAKGKKPIEEEWEKSRLDEDAIRRVFKASHNVGIILGASGLTDLDFDDDIAVTARHYIDPAELRDAASFEHAGRPHLVVRAVVPTRRFKRANGSVLLELRSEGAQTIFPPSVHPDGLPYTWTDDREPPQVDPARLQTIASMIATAAYASEFWKPKGRHDLAMALSGFLARRIGLTDALAVIQAAASMAGDEELDDRLLAVETTVQRLRSGESVTGLPTLESIAPDLAKALSKWWGRPPVDQAADDENSVGPYRATADGLVWMKPTRDGPVATPLTNFVARIVADIVEDDGAEERRSFEIEAMLRHRTHRFKIPAAQFPGMTWATEHLGAAATCYPGTTTKDHARFAIQLFSRDVPTRRIYAHTGWRRLEAGWAFLHGEGGIGEGGHIAGIETGLSGALARFVLPKPPTDEAAGAAMKASLRLLDLGPMHLTVPLLAATYLAPLCEPLEDCRPDFVSWFHGPTGAFKSEIAALAESHYGHFSRQTLPASFTDTANSVERILFAAKDVLTVVDDYHPAHDRREEQAMATNASRLLRGVGNGSGRQRMRADTSLRPSLPPRTLAMATGERLPAGHSTGARLFPIPVSRGDVASDRLSAAQAESALYPLAMAAYVQWIARRFDDLRASMKARFTELRTTARSDGHPRHAAQVAHLQVGVETALQFAVDAGAIDECRMEQLRDDAWRALLSLSGAHQDDLNEESPVHLFVALLADGFASRRSFVESMSAEAPQDAATWGWLSRRYTDERGECIEFSRPNGGTLLGHIDAEWLYLIPEATMQFITSASNAADRHFPVDQRTLLRRLAEAELIATQGERRVVNQRILGDTRRVIKLKRAALSLLVEEREQREHGEQEPESDSTVPVGRSRTQPLGDDFGNRFRERSDSDRAHVPAVPAVPADRHIEENEVFVL